MVTHGFGSDSIVLLGVPHWQWTHYVYIVPLMGTPQVWLKVIFIQYTDTLCIGLKGYSESSLLHRFF